MNIIHYGVFVKGLMDIIWTQLKILRKSYNFTQKQVAEYLGMTQGGYQKVEAGERDLTAEIIVKLCKLYKVSADVILEQE